MNDITLSTLLVGDSAPMRKLRALVTKVACTALPVLIEGETGTGKELVARALHLMSGRAGALVSVNICAIAEPMFEDALFGHEQGGYTGATRAVAGYMAEADGGTLFLDEIGSLPLGNQVKLLRVVETREFRPLGANINRTSNFRLVSATNESLEGLAEGGQFRWDLAHRLSGVRVRVPPLRARADDIPALVRHLSGALPVATYKPMSSSALDVLQGYSWPGNVRELRNIVEAAVAISHGSQVERGDIEALLAAPRSWRKAPVRNEPRDAQLLAKLKETSWDVSKAARQLGIHRTTIYRHLRRLGRMTERGLNRSSEEMCEKEA
jgi:DNA-binding NtrC family response regulator